MSSASVPDGVYYAGAVADFSSSVAELFEDNNAKVGNRVGVGTAPDFYVAEVSSGTAVAPGGQVQVSVTLCNQGTQYGFPEPFLFFSTDEVIDGEDLMAGQLYPMPYLAPGACDVVSGMAYAPPGSGVFPIRASFA